MYRSVPEKEFSHYLEEEGIDFSYEDFRIPYVVSKHYTPDFFVHDYGFFIEYKGYFKPSDRKKHLLIKKQHPNFDIRFIFQNAGNKLSKRSSTTYADWCDRYNFLWSQGRIPKQWLRKQK